MARTVLVVDDLSFARRTLIKILSEAHFQVVGEAENGKEAVKMYDKLKPDMVMMDVVMPEMSGIEATREIMKTDGLAKILIISAMTQENIIMEALNAGAKDYIVKPYSSQEIIRAADHLMLADATLIQKLASRG